MTEYKLPTLIIRYTLILQEFKLKFSKELKEGTFVSALAAFSSHTEVLFDILERILYTVHEKKLSAAIKRVYKENPELLARMKELTQK